MDYPDNTLTMEAFVVSENPHTLEDAKSILESISSGRYGKWKPTKASGGMIVDSMDGVQGDLLAGMRPPRHCIYFSLMTAIRPDDYPGDLRAALPELIRPFTFAGELSSRYSMILVKEDRHHTIDISLPNGSNPGVIVLRTKTNTTQAEKAALCALIGLESCLRDGEEIQLDLSDMPTVRLKKPRKYESGTHIVFDDFPSAVGLLTANLAADTECGRLHNVSFKLIAGYLDDDEELEDGIYDDAYRTVAESVRLSEFYLSAKRVELNGTWEEKEEARQAIGDGPGFMESLGSITDGAGATVEVALQYDGAGYTYLFGGFEEIEDADSSILAIGQDIPLTM